MDEESEMLEATRPPQIYKLESRIGAWYLPRLAARYDRWDADPRQRTSRKNRRALIPPGEYSFLWASSALAVTLGRWCYLPGGILLFVAGLMGGSSRSRSSSNLQWVFAVLGITFLAAGICLGVYAGWRFITCRRIRLRPPGHSGSAGHS